jgi:site-specific DNA-methyltransferase (adenine-specific)
VTEHRIECADALAFLRSLAYGSVDAIITDPPYGTNDGRGKRCGVGNSGAVVFALEWDKALPLEWLTEAVRVLKPGGACVVFTDAKRPGDVWDAGEKAGLRARNTFYWSKPDPPPTPRPNFASAVEVGVYFVNPGATSTWHGGGWCRNVFECVLAHKEIDGQTRFHPTQKPVGVMRWLVELVTNPGDVVVDPFCGSGTTGVACVATGRGFVGCDLSAEFVDVARGRLDAWRRLGRDIPTVETDPRQMGLGL